MTKLGAIEIFLVEFVIFLGFWIFDEYLGTLMTTLFAPISFFLLLVAWIAERIEPSRVPSWYFTLMICSCLAPIAAALAYKGVGYWV